MKERWREESRKWKTNREGDGDERTRYKHGEGNKAWLGFRLGCNYLYIYTCMHTTFLHLYTQDEMKRSYPNPKLTPQVRSWSKSMFDSVKWVHGSKQYYFSRPKFEFLRIIQKKFLKILKNETNISIKFSRSSSDPAQVILDLLSIELVLVSRPWNQCKQYLIKRYNRGKILWCYI